VQNEYCEKIGAIKVNMNMVESYDIRVSGDGSKEYRRNGQICKIEYTSGLVTWWKDSCRHREDGPAIEKANGDKEWYLNGEYITNHPLVFIIKLHEFRLTSSLIPV